MNNAGGATQAAGQPAGSKDLGAALSSAAYQGALPIVSTAADGDLGLRVAYIHGYQTGGDTTATDAWRALLEARGFLTFPLAQDDVAGADFSACELILVGADTGGWTRGGGPTRRHARLC
jgi:hypothetical protein